MITSLLQRTYYMIIISFSDTNYNHNGYTYQALNFYYTGLGGGVEEYSLNKKCYHKRHLNKYWFILKNLKFDDNLTINQNFELNGGIIIKQKPKHRYVYFLGSKLQKKDMLKIFGIRSINIICFL